ncbi:MAG: hypothetical protein CL534_15400 [Ahrensia sp.]|nr:hypothetical protein [Ahrensia sp.]
MLNFKRGVRASHALDASRSEEPLRQDHKRRQRQHSAIRENARASPAIFLPRARTQSPDCVRRNSRMVPLTPMNASNPNVNESRDR